MKVTVLSMSQTKFYEPDQKAAIIRVHDGGYNLDSIQGHYGNVLTMSFYDIVPKAGLPVNWNYFNMDDGENLLKFFQNLSEGFNELVIHCHAGVSRSPAIAIAYGWFAGDNRIIEQIKQGNYIPNSQVLHIMSRMIFKDRFVARDKLKEIQSFYANKAIQEQKIKKEEVL